VLTVLKLGGSVITHKDEPETVDEESLAKTCEVIASFLAQEESEQNSGRRHQLVLVHGGGSFGHHHASGHGVTSTEGTEDAQVLTAIHRAMGRLNDVVLDALHDQGVPALPVRPLSMARRDKAGLSFPADQFEAMLSEGFVPVTHGDVVVDTDVGGTVLSGDDIVVSLAESLAADRVGLCSTVPGVLDESGAVVPAIDSYEEVASILGESESTDVTGGMAHKIRQLLQLDVPASVFDIDSLERFLQDERAGTVVRG